MSQSQPESQTASTPQTACPAGMWLVGARGAISTCLLYGLHGLRQGLLEPVGLVTESEPFRGLSMVPLENLVLGGHDVCERDVSSAAGELVRAGVLDADLVTSGAGEAAAYEARLRPGPLDGPDVGVADLDGRSAELGARPPRDQVAQVCGDWDAFEKDNGIERTVVVFVASTEAVREPQEEWADLASFEAALDRGDPQPASVIYAYAALSSGRPLVNFTPSLASSVPALRQLAEERGVPHCGSDGKTGETLVKTVLAPMFAARGLKVHAWQGYNMLGNRDGEVLRDPNHAAAKIQHKDDVLRGILGPDSDHHSKVGIDYVPSLGDWKTAMDFIHFEGFLGARMSLQFTWAGCDSSLAAPLVLDLVRLAHLSAERGEGGVMDHTACFFKAPLAGGSHDFHEQHARLLAYVASCQR